MDEVRVLILEYAQTIDKTIEVCYYLAWRVFITLFLMHRNEMIQN